MIFPGVTMMPSKSSGWWRGGTGVSAALLLLGTAAGAQETVPGVAVTLQFSVKEFDPSHPGKATVRCVVRNNSKAAVEVPAQFHHRLTKLEAAGLQLVHQGLEKKKVSDAGVRLEPGAERTIFELSLEEVLLRRGKDNPWYWSWMRRPPPPVSPIHLPREKDKFIDSATFVVTVLVNGKPVVSSPVELKVKQK
jgi:hypothetical protein